MPDPSTLLLLACTNCVSPPPSASDLPDTQCSQVQNSTANQTANQEVSSQSCMSLPETDLAPLHSPKSQTSGVASDAVSPTSSTLRLGSRGEAVVQLQTKLQELGHYQGVIDGVYGPQTRWAVSLYQRSAQIKVDGVVGATTWTALQSTAPESESIVDQAVVAKAADPAIPAGVNAAPNGDGVGTTAAAASTPSATIESQLTSPDDGVGIAAASTPSAAVESQLTSPQANAEVNPESTESALVYKKSQVLLIPLGWVVGISVAAGLVFLLKSQGALIQQWRLQFQNGWALPDGSLSDYGDSNSQSAQPVVLEQSKIWSRAIVWSIAGVTSFVVIWACGAKVEETVPVKGKLEPQSAVKEVQAPVGGVIEKIHVDEGELVESGQLLVSFDPTTAKAQFESLQEIRNTLIEENKFYRSQLQPSSGSPTDGTIFGQSNVSPKLISLTENRAALLAENQLYQAELSGDTDGAGLSVEQKERLRARQLSRQSRIADARFQIEQLNQQLQQAHTQLTSNQLALSTNQTITDSLGELVDKGAYARLPYLQQELETNRLQAEVSRLMQEEQRLRFAIAQAQQRLQTEVASSAEDLFARMTENNKRIAEIDSQLTKVILENENRINELNSQLSSVELTLRYQELRAPISGVVFNLKPRSTGYVYNSSEQILEIVPRDDLVAQVFITNQDIGFVHEGMPVDVRIDSFPFQEFGDIDGELTRIGSDVLPPDETYQFYRFPAEVKMKDQFINVEGHEIPLHSGMSLTANINIRKRSVITIFFDLFSEKIESLRRK
ncbi:MAG: HlyD family efflux transporter periplasmic adaptor subunit [Leptolyngbyaceae cyanobacterium MO_188.B28]|nr:HlyD family efflux transporter periplasmic adaptor subunit [Leptolyngbyaceae cyanobacterium MO_188.B28]